MVVKIPLKMVVGTDKLNFVAIQLSEEESHLSKHLVWNKTIRSSNMVPAAQCDLASKSKVTTEYLDLMSKTRWLPLLLCSSILLEHASRPTHHERLKCFV